MSTFDIYKVVRDVVEEVLNEKNKKRGGDQKNSSESAYLTVEEAARELNIKVSRMRTAIFRNEVPYVKIGSLVRVPRLDLHDHFKNALLLPKSSRE